VQLRRNGSLASHVPSLARVLVVGSIDDDLATGLAARRCEVRQYGEGAPGEAYDAAILVAFPNDAGATAAFLRDLASGLAAEGRLILDATRLAAPAVRETVSDRESSENDVLLYGTYSIVALLEEAGLTVLPSAPGAHVLEATLAPPAGAIPTPVEPVARPFANEIVAPDQSDRLAYAEREVSELRAFFKVIHDNGRRLQEELARTRSAVGDRDLEIAKLRAEILRSLGRTPEEDDRDRTIALRDAELREVKGRVADLETRVVRLRETLVDLRDGPIQASTE
jgi:hypothetical protein